MRYYSTNHKSPTVSFSEAMAKSEAADGGLYLPERLPILPKAFINNITGMTLKDITFVVSSMLCGDDVTPTTLKRMCDEVSSMPLPVFEIEPGIMVMETFHGPTRTVKDFGAGFLSHMMKAMHLTDQAPLNVLIATSGHSGAALAHGFNNMPGTNVFVLYPRFTSYDHLELITSMGPNIHPIEVSGTIDNCRAMIARAFDDPELKDTFTFTSANSTNLGFLLPYVGLYFYAYSQMIRKAKKDSDLYISIPTGHCGNLLGAYMAKKMGMPVTKLVAACNANAYFHQFLKHGKQTSTLIQRTYAYGMDSLRSANIPRFSELCQNDMESLRTDITSGICTDPEILRTIKSVHESTGYQLDPHSAVAYKCLKETLPQGATGLFVATAPPSRSAEAMERTKKGKLNAPYMLNHNYCKRPEATIPPTYGALKKFLKYYCDDSAMQNRG